MRKISKTVKIIDERESVNVLYDSDATENEAVDGSGVWATDNENGKWNIVNGKVEFGKL